MGEIGTKKESKCEIENSHDSNTICFLFPRSVWHHVQVVLLLSSRSLVDKKRDNLHLEETTEWVHTDQVRNILSTRRTHALRAIFIYCIGFHRSNDIKNVSIMLFCFVSFRSVHSVTFRCIYLSSSSSMSFLCMFYYTISSISVRAYAILY